MPARADRLRPGDLERHVRWLRRLAIDLARDPETANDLVQDTYVAALRRPPPPGSPVRPWLGGVLRNVWRMWIRTDTRRERREAESETPESAPPPDALLDAAWASRALLEEVDRLGEPYRSTVMMRYYEGLKAAEVASMLGIPAATVRKRSQLALEELRRRLDHRGENEAEPWRSSLARAVVPAGLLGAVGATTKKLVERPALAAGVGAAAGVVLLAAVGTGAVPRLGLGGLARAGGAPADARTGTGSPRSAHERLLRGLRSLAPDRAGPETETNGVAPPATPATAEPERATGRRNDCPPLQPELDRAAAGATIEVPACIHRERLTILKPVQLIGKPGAEIRGSDVWTAWRRTTPGGEAKTAWQSDEVVPPFADPWRECVTKTEGPCLGPEQVFRDGLALRRVAARPAAGEFALDEARHVLLGDDPSGHLLEVTTRVGFVSIAASDVTVRGLRLRHAAGMEHTFSVVNPSRRVRLQGNVLSDAAGPGFTVAGFEHLVEGNEVFATGADGIRVEPGAGTIIRANKIHDTGARDAGPPSWRTGGITSIYASARFENNEIFETRGLGIHLVKNDRTQLVGNVIHDNPGGGIAINASTVVEVAGNRMWRNGGEAQPPEPGLFVVSSRHVEVKDNVLVEHPFGLYVGPKRRRRLPTSFDTCTDTAEIYVHDNVLAGAGRPIVISGDPREEDSLPPCGTIRTERNRVLGANPSELRSGDIAVAEHERATLLDRAGVPRR